jgi:hypothetical protein
MHDFINNTVADNVSYSNTPGLSCITNPINAINNVFYHNQLATQPSLKLEVDCVTAYSCTDDFRDAARPTNVDLTTIKPGFAAFGDYHLVQSSPCIGKGTSAGAPDHDFDGNVRPDPTSKLVDIGAYEAQ